MMLVGGLSCLGWVGYQYLGTNVVAEKAFKSERTDLRSKWAAEKKTSTAKPGKVDTTAAKKTSGPNGAREPKETRATAETRAATEETRATEEPRETIIPGDAIALLRIPRFGDTYEIPILSGTDLSILDRGVGHYTSTAMPGEIGNFAVAGHRVTHGQPFSRLLELNSGDEVVVETRDAVYTYVLDEPPKDLTVSDTETWVIDPVPGQTGVKPSTPIITLTTCQDLFQSPDRSIGFGHLASTKNKA